MSYIIHTSSGTLLTTIPTGKINTGSTSITLIGRDVTNYGRYYNQNLVNMLGNFANVTNKPPAHPLQGQLWYDTTYKKLKVYNGGYGVVGAAVVSEMQPIGQEPGELWYDVRNQALNFLDDNGQYNSITSFPRSDVSGWKFPLTPVYDNTVPGSIQQVTLLQSYGEVVGALTTASFIASEHDSLTTFGLAGTSSFAVAAGLTVIGNIHATGKLTADSGIEFGNVLQFEGGPTIGSIQSTNVYKQAGSLDLVTTSTDLLLSSNAGVVFDLAPFDEVTNASPAIKIIDSQNDGYAPIDGTTLNVGRIYHSYGAMVIESDGSIFLNDVPQETLDGYGQLMLKNLDGSAGIVLGGPLDDYFSGGNLGTVSVTAGTSSTWVFGVDGNLTVPGMVQFPNLARIDATGTNAVFQSLNSFVIETDKGNTKPTWEFGINGILTLPSGVGDIYRDGVSVLGGGGGILSLNTATPTVLGGIKIGTGFDITADGTASVSPFNTSTLVANSVNAQTAGYATTFNTSTLVANSVNAQTAGYATTFNTSTLVANSVNAKIAISSTTATNAAYAYSFNTGTLVANAVHAQTSDSVVGGVGITSISAGTGTAVSTVGGVATIWNTTPAVTGLQSRATASTTTVSLTAGSSTTATVTMAKGYALYSIQTNASAWVTLYTSLATQASDSGRSITTDPTPGSGVLAEAITTGSTTVNFTPAVYGYNLDPSVNTNGYLKIYNNGASPTAITVTLTYLKLEV